MLYADCGVEVLTALLLVGLGVGDRVVLGVLVGVGDGVGVREGVGVGLGVGKGVGEAVGLGEGEAVGKKIAISSIWADFLSVLFMESLKSTQIILGPNVEVSKV